MIRIGAGGMLYAAFGWGAWKSAGSSRALRIAGGAIVATAFVGLFWPPMHLREVLAAGGGTGTDTLHFGWAAANGVLTLLAMGFAAAARSSLAILLFLFVMTSCDRSLPTDRSEPGTPSAVLMSNCLLSAATCDKIDQAIGLMETSGVERCEQAGAAARTRFNHPTQGFQPAGHPTFDSFVVMQQDAGTGNWEATDGVTYVTPSGEFLGVIEMGALFAGHEEEHQAARDDPSHTTGQADATYNICFMVLGGGS